MDGMGWMGHDLLFSLSFSFLLVLHFISSFSTSFVEDMQLLLCFSVVPGSFRADRMVRAFLFFISFLLLPLPWICSFLLVILLF
jgi:hypothetical protein